MYNFVFCYGMVFLTESRIRSNKSILGKNKKYRDFSVLVVRKLSEINWALINQILKVKKKKKKDS